MVAVNVRDQNQVGLRQACEDGGLGWINHDHLATRFDNQGCVIDRCDLDWACG